MQPGHEYTKGNVKFGVTVSQSEAIKKLESFATSNKETQGKFTIGDEKKHNVFMRLDVSLRVKSKRNCTDCAHRIRWFRNSLVRLTALESWRH